MKNRRIFYLFLFSFAVFILILDQSKSRSRELNIQAEFRSMTDQMTGVPIVTFTNEAGIYFVQHFVCNLASLGLSEQLIVIVSDQTGYHQLAEFQAQAR